MSPAPLRIQLIVTLVLLTVVFWSRTPQHATSFAVGAGMVAVNWWALAFVWDRLIAKKSIALAIGVIVIKWAFFGAICIGIVRLDWIDSTWLVLGVSSIIPTVLILALKKQS